MTRVPWIEISTSRFQHGSHCLRVCSLAFGVSNNSALPLPSVGDNTVLSLLKDIYSEGQSHGYDLTACEKDTRTRRQWLFYYSRWVAQGPGMGNTWRIHVHLKSFVWFGKVDCLFIRIRSSSNKNREFHERWERENVRYLYTWLGYSATYNAWGSYISWYFMGGFVLSRLLSIDAHGHFFFLALALFLNPKESHFLWRNYDGWHPGDSARIWPSLVKVHKWWEETARFKFD